MPGPVIGLGQSLHDGRERFGVCVLEDVADGGEVVPLVVGVGVEVGDVGFEEVDVEVDAAAGGVECGLVAGVFEVGVEEAPCCLWWCACFGFFYEVVGGVHVLDFGVHVG